MRTRNTSFVTLVLLAVVGIAIFSLGPHAVAQAQQSDPIADNARIMLDQGRRTFRFDTFGDEAF